MDLIPDNARPDVDAVGHARVRNLASARLVRCWSALILVCAATVIGVAIYLKPDSRGYGTHQQLGAGPCGMLITTGLPCPTCGMTTAFSMTVRFRWLSALYAQPGGFILALATIAAGVLSLQSLITGRVPVICLTWLTPYRLFFALLVLLVGGWGCKLLFGLLDGSLPVRGVKL